MLKNHSVSASEGEKEVQSFSDKGCKPLKLFDHEPDLTQEVLAKFENLEDCIYANKRIGTFKNNDFMECDCYEEFSDGVNHACDEDSDCINRLTLIECVNDLCSSCGNDCQNQRFQKKQYSPIAIFKTKYKGYGVRAEEDIEANQFIYEYKGEVIEEMEFRERLIDYDQRHFKHFYFMMLQNGEFIDATIKGSLARFCNHSCSPNAYVNKWVVKGKLRMGIFAQKKILKGEEITFDYNVDRYGAQAQKCYCEEPNCIGFLGGKTQTDAASLLPQNIADALGVTVSMEKKWLKLKKSSGEPIIKNENENVNIEFLQSLEIQFIDNPADVTKIMSVLLQQDNKIIASKLLNRLFTIDDNSLRHQAIKLHGYTCFSKMLKLFDPEQPSQQVPEGEIEDGEDDNKLMTKKILDFLLELPKTTKNGIESSGIDDLIKALSVKCSDLKPECDELIEKWSKFETYKRITKRDINVASNKMIDLRRVRLPPGWEIIHENGRPLYYNAEQKTKLHYPPTGSSKVFSSRSNTPVDSTNSSGILKTAIASDPKKHKLSDEEYERKKQKRLEYERIALERTKQEELESLKEKLKLENERKSVLEDIIAEANKQKELQKEEAKKLVEAKEAKRLKRKTVSQSQRIEHNWNKFFASFVPNLIRSNPQSKQFDHENIKQCAKDIVRILTTKELKKNSLRAPPDDLSKEKRHKVKEFIKSYMDKIFLKKKQKKALVSTPASTRLTSPPPSTSS
ncbi:set2p [Saccharomyces arboricola H-6]|uniref:Histone-lysine N-methyltransferase, H3 lysine-36 specific n=1 Tax=Saccharomyces arboricola (strain H-6 / AS 2.3317 / CBS 10644) TaxID=1160507 RepID=J8Q6K1_SACAR|nr:set2p [Saccharomyces arboricola H-6]